MAARKINVLIREPGKEARIEEIEDDWKTYSEIMGGGFIETVAMPGIKGVRAIIDDEGKLKSLAPNIYLPEYDDLLVGTAIFVTTKGENFAGLDDAQIEKVKAYISINDASAFAGDTEDFNNVEIYSFEGPDAKDEFFNFLFGGGKQSDSEM